MSKNSVWSITIGVACAIMYGGNGYAQDIGVTDTTIKIGMFNPLTGPVSSQGGPSNHGAIMLYNQVNDAGGIAGRKIEVVELDDMCDTAGGVAAVKRLIYSDQVFMLHGGNCSVSVLAALPEIVRNKVPLVTTGTADRIATPLNPTVFRTSIRASHDGEIIGNFIASIPGAKRVAVISAGNEWSDSKTGSMYKLLEQKGIQIVAREELRDKSTDATAQVLKIKQQNPDATAVILFPAESAVFLRDALKYQLGGRFVGTGSIMDLHDLAARAGTPEAVKSVFVGAFLREPIESPQMATYNNLFHKYYPSERLQTSVYFLSAGAEVIIEALKRAGRDLTRAKFVAELEKLKGFRSTFNACDISFSAESHEGCLTGTMWRLINNKIVNVGPVWTADSK